MSDTNPPPAGLPPQTNHKAYVGAVTSLLTWAYARLSGAEPPPIEDFLAAIQLIGEGLIAWAIGWIAVYAYPNKTKGGQ